MALMISYLTCSLIFNLEWKVGPDPTRSRSDPKILDLDRIHACHAPPRLEYIWDPTQDPTLFMELKVQLPKFEQILLAPNLDPYFFIQKKKRFYSSQPNRSMTGQAGLKGFGG